GEIMWSKTRYPVRFALVAAVAGAVISVPHVALANARSHTDPSADVEAFVFGSPVTDATENETADIVRVRTVHTRPAFKIRLKLRDLVTTRWDYLAKVQTPRLTYRVHVGRGGAIEIRERNPGGFGVPCRHASASSDPTMDIATLRI